jgi:Domain of unknown function (DUF4386)
MNTNRKTAIIVGVLFIIATATDLLSLPFLGFTHNPDYLIKISTHESQVLIGALLQLIAAFTCPCIAIWLYPILKKHNESLAFGSVSFRIIEGVLYIVGLIGVLSLLTLSQELVKAGASDLSYFQTSGALLLAVQDWANLIGALAFYLGAMMYYSIFHQSKLIPRWLSGWGLVGVTLGIIAGLLVMFRLTSPMSTIQVVFNLPIAVQEMVLAVWLIVKGFNPSAIIASGVGRTDATQV